MIYLNKNPFEELPLKQKFEAGAFSVVNLAQNVILLVLLIILENN